MPTGNSVAYTATTSLSDLYKKTNTDLMVGLKRKTEEYDWFDDLPDFKIIPSQNEMRLVLDVIYQPDTIAAIPENGYEGVLTTQAPTHGTVSFVQWNARYAISTLYQALDKRGRQGMIERQVQFESVKAVEAFARKIGLSTYGFSTGTKAVVATTTSSGTTQNGVALKNAYGSSLVPGGTTAQNTYLSFIFRTGDPIAVIHTGAILEFGSIVASPSVGSGVGFVDILMNSSVTLTSGDLILAAAAVTDNTLTGTDQNRWPVGLFDISTSASLHGLSGSGNQWNAALNDSTGGRMSFSRLEQGINAIWNQGGVKPNRIIWSQGVRRDVISGERASMVYDSAGFNLDGDVGRKGFVDRTSVLVPSGCMWAYNNNVIQKKVLSDKPAYEGGPSMFTLDKAQDKGAYAASLDYVFLKACTNRSGVAVWSSLQEQ